jgi:hypothetical protein
MIATPTVSLAGIAAKLRECARRAPSGDDNVDSFVKSALADIEKMTPGGGRVAHAESLSPLKSAINAAIRKVAETSARAAAAHARTVASAGIIDKSAAVTAPLARKAG